MGQSSSKQSEVAATSGKTYHIVETDISPLDLFKANNKLNRPKPIEAEKQPEQVLAELVEAEKKDQ